MKAGFLALLFLAACSPETPAPRKVEAPPKPAVADPPAGARHFGAPSTQQGELLSVADVMRDPAPHLGKSVRCSGVVSRVCQRAGCWLELSADGQGQGLRVPMAGHAFFIPQDAVGKHAVIEGELSALPLSPGARAHLESEGLQAIGPLALSATSVDLAAQ